MAFVKALFNLYHQENGYTLIQVHEVWHYKTTMIYDKDKKEGGLF